MDELKKENIKNEIMRVIIPYEDKKGTEILTEIEKGLRISNKSLRRKINDIVYNLSNQDKKIIITEALNDLKIYFSTPKFRRKGIGARVYL